MTKQFPFIDTTNYQDYINNDAKKSTKKFIITHYMTIIEWIILFFCLILVYIRLNFMPLFVYIALLCVYKLLWKRL